MPIRSLILSAVMLLTGAAVVAPFAISRADDGDTITPQAAAGSTFTYQGRLEVDGVPANGNHEFSFELFSDAAGTQSIAFTQMTRPVTNGLFTAELDFGDGAFNGDERWLQVYVKQGANFVTVGTVQKLTATPYALYALNVGEHSHFGDEWTGSGSRALGLTNNAEAGFGLQVTTAGSNSRGIVVTNNGNCNSSGKVCYGLWASATLFPGGSGFGGVGVRGDGTNAGVLGTGPQYGVYGDSPNGIGVNGGSATGTGVYAYSGGDLTDAALRAVGENFASGIVATSDFGAIYGTSTTYIGIIGEGPSGISGSATLIDGRGVSGNANVNNGIGVSGYSVQASSTGVGVKGTGSRIGVWGVHSSFNPSLPAGTWAGYFNGNVFVTGSLTATSYVTSDARLKNNIRDITYGLDTVMDIRPVAYALNDDPESKEHLGVIAQEIEAVLPGVVNRPEDPEEMLAVNYTELIPVLIKAVQEQQAQIEALSAGSLAPAAKDVPASVSVDKSGAVADPRVDALQGELAALRAQVEGSGDSSWPMPIVAGLVFALLAAGGGAGFGLGRMRRS